MYTVHHQTLTPVRDPLHGQVLHYFSQVTVSVGGRELFYKQLTEPREIEIFGYTRTKQRVLYKLRKGIMYEIEAYLFKVDTDGKAMGPQL